jgi:hypothetical protein|tara:strand:+ start:1071 stop:1181 length:111 start_codon:yes stop_codon:yes gene_type:complete
MGTSRYDAQDCKVGIDSCKECPRYMDDCDGNEEDLE